MSSIEITNSADWLTSRLDRALANLGRPVARGTRAVISGVGHRGIEGGDEERAISAVREALIATGRFYLRSDEIVYDDPGQGLTTVAVGLRLADVAGAILGRHLIFENRQSERFVAGPALLPLFLFDERMREGLPVMRLHARRPAFDEQFNLCTAGWNLESGFLIDCPELPELECSRAPDAATILARLPHHLRELLGGFCWESDSDLVHAVAMLLTGLLINRFVEQPHPFCVIHGNQPAIGKSLLAQTFGMVLDGEVPRYLALCEDEEIDKVLGANLEASRSSIFHFDNVRGPVASEAIERASLAPAINVRRLGHNSWIEGPNVYLWCMTTNDAVLTRDLMTRSLPIRLRYLGDPSLRRVSGDPVEFARRDRMAILAELAEMVTSWAADGPAYGDETGHRCRCWVATMRGILDHCGLGGPFLGNLEAAAAVMDEQVAALIELAAALASSPHDPKHATKGQPADRKGSLVGSWVERARESSVLAERLASCPSDRSEQTKLGKFLKSVVDREVRFIEGGSRWAATLRLRDGGVNRRFYYFEFECLGPADGDGVRAADRGGPRP